MDMRTPRILFSSAAGMSEDLLPVNFDAAVGAPLLASSPMIDMKIWLLPEPDLPTMPTRLAGRTPAKLTPLHAPRLPSGVAKRGLEAGHVEDGTVAARRRPCQRSFGSKASRRPSPTKLRQKQRDTPGRSPGMMHPGRDLHLDRRPR